MHKKSPFLFLFFLLLTANIYCQDKSIIISGVVLDVNNQPIPDINVLLKGTTYGAATNFNGEFTFKKIPASSYTIIAKGIGFKSQAKYYKLSNNNEPYFKFILQEDLEAIEEVVIKGKTVATRIETKGFNVQAIEMAQIKTQSLEINKVLDKSPGVRVRTTGGVGSDFEYRLNGMSGNSIRFFIDEIPMSYYGSSYSINNIPVGLIERIEVYKGVVPVELGSDALGGAINLVTNQEVSNYLEGSTSVGSFYSLQSNLNGQWRLKSGLTTKLALISSYSENNYNVWGQGVNYGDENNGYKTVEFTKDNPAERFNDDFQSLTAKVDIGFTKKKWADKFFVGLLASDLKKGVQTASTMGIVFGEVRNNRKTLMPNMIYKKKNFLKKGLDVNAFAAHSFFEGVLIDTSSVQYDWRGEVIGLPRDLGGEISYFGKTKFTTKDHAQIYRLNTNYKLPLNFKLGLNYLFEYNKRSGEEEFPNSALNRAAYIDPQTLAKHFAGLSIETNQFNNKLNVNGFVKYYGFNSSLNNLEFTTEYEVQEIQNKLNNFGVGFASSLTITPNFLIKTSLEQATRMPTPTESMGDGIFVVSNPFIEPEQSFNVNIGFVLGKYSIGSNQGIKITMSGFYRDTKDKIQPIIADSQESVKYDNIDAISGTGIELDIAYDLSDNLKFNVNGTYTNLRNNLEIDRFGNENIVYKERLGNEPYLMANAGFQYSLKNFIQKKSKLNAYLGSSYVHEFFLGWPILASEGNKSFIPSQLVFDTGLGYTFPSKKLTLALDVSNILNEQVYDNFLLQKPGRAFFLKATYQFIKK